MVQSVFELQCAAADVAQILAQQAYGRRLFNVRSSFLDLLFIDKNLPGEDERLRALARLDESAINQQFVEPDLHPPRLANPGGFPTHKRYQTAPRNQCKAEKTASLHVS